MLLALGFTAAILAALLFGRLAWNVALKLGQRRRRQDAPVELLDLQADRDRLRAEYAVLSRKLELRLDDLKTRLVEQMAEVSRNRNRILILMEELKVRDSALEEKTAEAEALLNRRQTLETELAQRTDALETVEAESSERSEALSKAEAQVKSLTAALADRDRQIAAMRQALGKPPQPAAFAEPEGEAAPVQERLKRRIDELTALSSEIAGQRAALRQERDALEDVRRSTAEARPMEPAYVSQPLEAKLDDAMRDADELAAELRRLDELWNSKSPGTAAPAAPMPDEAEPAPVKRRSGGVANVISLAQRIRALKSDLKS